ncbi:MAG TPA: leucine--tRNA ligase [Methylomirabilota bacterium]
MLRDGPRDAYRPAELEAKWQRLWEERGTYRPSDTALRAAARPFYNLMMFPYPSAEGLHVGNMYAFTGADIYGRWRRMQSDDVFEPIGFDAFGIHSENFALKVGTHPMDLIPKNVANFTRQLKRSGAMYDWSRTVDTTDPRYYKWTQWIFVQLFRRGLAQKREAPVNWCPSCKTVLANEQVVAGTCERCGSAVQQRVLSQWFFAITAYAQRLLDNLRWIDWSETTRRAQEQWIGRSEGADLQFLLAGLPAAGDGNADRISVFTTRPDTVFGATFMVLAPEHPLVTAVTTADRRAEVDAYRVAVAAMDLVTRKKTDKRKTGVFTGGYCVNPATGAEIPIWIADYVLMEFGTGAIMAVPGHDVRDFEFARQYGLPIIRVVAESPDGARAPLEEAYLGPGILVQSGRFSGLDVEAGKRAITEWLQERGLGAPGVHYRLHDWCISRQRYWGPPIPIIYCPRCGAVPVPERDLPVTLPYAEDYRPDESGTSPLARIAAWYRVACPSCGGEGRRETDVSDTFLDSAWYFLRYPSANRDDVPFDQEVTRRWLPVDMYIGGEEHAVLHLLYSRFVTMALHDAGLLDFEEPFTRFRKHGLLVKDGAKMSKSRGNVVIPDDYIERWGADTFRTYLMFLGPYQEGGDFRDQGLQGPAGFLNRLWETVVPVDGLGADPPAAGLERSLHATIRKVTEDIATLRYNTAIAALMEYLNAVRQGGRRANRAEVEPLVQLVAPFAPHIAEELWERLGHAGSLFDGGTWPAWDPAKVVTDTVEIVVQVNGKVRGRLVLPRGASAETAQAAAVADETVGRILGHAAIRKIVVVPDRLVNIVL